MTSCENQQNSFQILENNSWADTTGLTDCYIINLTVIKHVLSKSNERVARVLFEISHDSDKIAVH